ncbi:ABC transporter permease [Salinibacterium sp. M195]|uniref:ABC transporter permease n=1 Tax=Salinibacterium sp. M195 TaxID=2583374 RepID=UPI001C638790|nr:ABC transporter permease [Salinibacterium sp. M195]QYH35878.1 ABC transporter permease [Salinibacterium sp. M195]
MTVSTDTPAPASVSTPATRLRSLGWIARRVGGGVFVLWAVATVIFFALRLIPGDPVDAILGGPGSQASAEAVAQIRADYGLDQPLIVQYFLAMGKLAVADFGTSYALKVAVAPYVLTQLWSTLVLTLASLVAAWLGALALTLATSGRGRVARALGSGLELLAAAVPHFWLASLLIILLSNTLHWLPPISVPGPLGLVLPVLTLALPLTGFLGQVMRESLANAYEQPFVLSARARGESEWGVRLRHVLRHAALPGISLSGWAFGSLLSGAVVVETIFARPGLGRTLLNAVTIRDIPVVTAVALLSALTFIIVTIATDVVDRIVDPRVTEVAAR